MLDSRTLSKMTDQEKRELIALLDEQARRKKLAKSAYKPHAGQLPIHLSQAKVRLVTSGNGFGKSCLAVHEAFWRAQGYNPITKQYTPVPANIAVVLDKPAKADEVFLEEARKWFVIKPEQLSKKGTPSTRTITFDNGSVITFYSHEQDPLTWESIEVDLGIWDEPPPRESYIGLRRGGRKKGTESRYLIIGTPLGQPWLKAELWDKWERGETKEIECFRGNTEENRQNLAEGYIESFSSALTEQERRIRLSGEWYHLGGLALAHLFKRDTHVIQAADIHWDASNPCVLAIDPHPSKAHHAIVMGADRDNQLYALAEIASKSIPRDFARQLRKLIAPYRIVDIVCDSLGSSEYTGGDGFKSFIQVCNEEGLRARATTYEDKSDEDFIARIQDCLKMPTEPDNFGRRRPKLLVSSNCPGLVRDIENVQWVKAKGLDQYKPKLDITHKDYLSCAKYALATNIAHSKGKEKAFYHKKQVYGFNVSPKPALTVPKNWRARG